MIGCVALTPTASQHLASRSHQAHLRAAADTCSDPRKYDFEPGISWRRLKNKALLRPSPAPIPMMTGGLGWIICYATTARICCSAGCQPPTGWLGANHNRQHSTHPPTLPTTTTTATTTTTSAASAATAIPLPMPPPGAPPPPPPL
ncbi:hypothetical protein AWZ03_009732 [Drosophila navojoa]|uniref:Uncharacterized protein n=1 Tax=Drosophila navojoa TaxID=7232 RepID=A0A484B597_DRONA|nr:hypothetical protein AWZ03_009732 [Drosophila navojoa]